VHRRLRSSDSRDFKAPHQHGNTLLELLGSTEGVEELAFGDVLVGDSASSVSLARRSDPLRRSSLRRSRKLPTCWPVVASMTWPRMRGADTASSALLARSDQGRR